MSRVVRIELSDEAYRIAEDAARRAGKTVEQWLLAPLEERTRSSGNGPAERPKPSPELLRFAGSISDPRFTADNERIDEELAKEYLDPHEDEV